MNKSISRRDVLTYGAVGATWLLVGCAPYKNAGHGVAYQPWHISNSETRPEFIAANAAILAASPHNTQPWKLHVTAAAIEVHADLERALGAMDSLRRELYIGLGCAVENCVLAAQAAGRTTTVTLLPDPATPTLAARIELAPAAPVPSPLRDAIADRRTNRFDYTGRAVANDILSGLLPSSTTRACDYAW